MNDGKLREVKKLSPRGAVVNKLNCNFVVSEFELQSGYYIPSQTNTHEKGMNSLISPAMG